MPGAIICSRSLFFFHRLRSSISAVNSPAALHVPSLGWKASRRCMSARMQPSNEPFTPGTTLKGDSGSAYKIDEIIADRRKPLLCVYRASTGGQKYIIKNMIPGEFEYQFDLQKSLSSCPNVRTVVDTVKEFELFIYPFLSADLLRLSQKDLPEDTRKEILRGALHGLAAIHEKSIVHNGKLTSPKNIVYSLILTIPLDIKANNILVDFTEDANGQLNIEKVQVSDLEDAVILPPGKWLSGPLCGNAMWRSAESWCRARQNQSSDIFSFGIVMIYVMLGELVFRVKDDQLKAQDSWRYILPLHISYFADEDGFNGLLSHIREDNPFYERLIALADNFGPGNPRQPFEYWEYVEPDLRDLICKMTNLDPKKRITAREALQHRWFSQVS